MRGALFTLGAFVLKTFGRFFKGVPPSQAVGILGTGATLGGLWNTVTGWFGNSVDQGADTGSGGVMGTIEEALEKASTAVQIAGALFAILVGVLIYNRRKK